MELTRKQKCAMLKCAKMIIDADEKITPEERDYFNGLITKLNADSEMIAEAAMMSDEEVAACIKEVEPDNPFSSERNVIVEEMNQIANVDGSFDKTELREYFKICEMALED